MYATVQSIHSVLSVWHKLIVLHVHLQEEPLLVLSNKLNLSSCNVVSIKTFTDIFV